MTSSPCATSSSQALAIARNGGGPTLIEAITYRLSDHTTADDASRYRPAEEVKNAWKVEPLIRLRKYLDRHAAPGAKTQETHSRPNVPARGRSGGRGILRTPKQSTDAMFDFLFAKPPRQLQEQREQARNYSSPSGAHGGSH